MKNKKIILAIIFSIVFTLLFKWAQTGNPFREESIVYAVIIFLNVIITGGIAYNTFKKFSVKSSEQLKKNIIPAYLIFTLAALVISLILIGIGVYSFYLIKGYSTANFFDHLFKVEFASALKQFTIWILLGSVFFFYVIWRKGIEREQRLHEENLKYQYRNLKSHVNPHFLFNSLNTLSEIVYSDAQKADRYIQMLSGIYRYILENEETDLISLNEELEFVKKYFCLQKERDDDKISLKIDCNDYEGYKIIPVSLQLLMENALKHNSASQNDPLDIRIYCNDDYVIVSNTLQRKNIIENPSQKGLSNLRERVRLITGKEIIVMENNKQFIVKVPIIKA